MHAAQTLTPGTTVLGHAVIGFYGERNGAELWLARDPADGQVRVIARTTLPLDEETADGTFPGGRQGHVLRLVHPHATRILRIGEDAEEGLAVLEWTDGRTLLQVGFACRLLNCSVPFVLLAHVLREALQGLHHAHVLAVDGVPLPLVHGGINPECIAVGFNGVVKLELMSRAVPAVHAGEMQRDELAGRVNYLAPEFLRGERVDARADVFSMGVTMFELLTNALPFPGRDAAAVSRAILSQAPFPPTELNPAVPAALSEICLRALEKDPARRFQSAAEMERALAAYLQRSRAVDDAHVAAFMGVLFPPERDVQRIRVSGLVPRVQVEGDVGASMFGDATIRDMTIPAANADAFGDTTAPDVSVITQAGLRPTERDQPTDGGWNAFNDSTLRDIGAPDAEILDASPEEIASWEPARQDVVNMLRDNRQHVSQAAFVDDTRKIPQVNWSRMVGPTAKPGRVAPARAPPGVQPVPDLPDAPPLFSIGQWAVLVAVVVVAAVLGMVAVRTLTAGPRPPAAEAR